MFLYINEKDIEQTTAMVYCYLKVTSNFSIFYKNYLTQPDTAASRISQG